MALREGLPNNMLQADGASTIRNLTVVVASSISYVEIIPKRRN